MRRTPGFDRLSTEEELHQVLAVLEEFGRNGWMIPGGDSPGSEEQPFWIQAGAETGDGTSEAESLADWIAKRPELKN